MSRKRMDNKGKILLSRGTPPIDLKLELKALGNLGKVLLKWDT